MRFGMQHIRRGLAGAVVALAAFSSASAQDLGDASWNYDIVFGGGSATGNSKILASALGKIITENVKGVRASGAVSPGYDAENAMNTIAGTWHGGVGTPLVLENAVNGVAPFPADGKKLRFWFSHNDVPLNMLAQKDSGVTKVSDLKGKTLAVAPKGTSNYMITEIVLAAHGLSMDDVDVAYMNTSEAINQLKDGKIDALSYVRDYSGAVLELTTARDVVLLQPEEAAVPKIIERMPWAGPIDWPFKKQYEAMTVPAPGVTFVSPEFMFLTGDLPNEVVYAMTKAVWENIKVVQQSSKVFEHVNLQDALKRVPIAPHPGAIQYYKEMNVPGWEKYAELLQ